MLRDRNKCRLRVKRNTLTVRRSLPVLPGQRTSPDRTGWSFQCQLQTFAASSGPTADDNLISQPHDLVLMKLFFAPGSSSLLPHIALHEAGLPFETVKIDEHTKAITGGGDYRSVNPLGYVPALVLDDGTLLTEGAAIVQYIADLVPSKELAPPNGTIERVRLQAWLNFFASEMHKGGFSPLFYKGVPENGRDVFRARLKARFEHLDGHLSANEYLMGSHYSVADTHFFVVSNWASWVNFDLSSYHAVIAHRERVGARPAVVAALRAEGLLPWPATQPN
jgi:glutathione S-transferase